MHISKKAFSLIEILIGILIVSIIMIAAFQALSSVGIAKVKLIEQIEIEKQAYYSSERFFELIKKGGILDYEEYWNRYSDSIIYLDGHYQGVSGFGNFGRDGTVETTTYGSEIYHCISNGGGANMGTGGCLQSNNIDFSLSTINSDNFLYPQRYSQYSLQFIDRNSDNDSDSDGINCTGPDAVLRTGTIGDENCDGSILGDDDDLFLGVGPVAFSGSSDANKVSELYLISNDGKERTYFRWNVTDVSGDPYAPTGANCTGLDTETPNGIGCQGTIEMLKLVGNDYGYDHEISTLDLDGSQGDNIIDTWMIHPDYAGGNTSVIAGSNSNNYWQAIFPSSVNIKNFELYAYPNKDINLSWRDNNDIILVSPYIQIKYIIEPSLKVKASIAGSPPSVEIATTIGLSNLDIK